MPDHIDDYAVQQLKSFGGHKLQAAAKKGLNIEVLRSL
jgi:hypothetical protein